MVRSSIQKNITTAIRDDKITPNNNNNNKAVVGVVKSKRTRKSIPRESSQQRSSIYRGVTRHRWMGRYEAHLWDKNCWNESQNKKGRQVYLGFLDLISKLALCNGSYLLPFSFAFNFEMDVGAYDDEESLTFLSPLIKKEVVEMEGQSKEEYLGSLRRKSSGFSRGVSKYRGVARRHHKGRWDARIGRVFGNKYLYLGTYATQEEAATVYDMAAIEYRGPNAVTSFDLSRYIKWLQPLQCQDYPGNPQSTPNYNAIKSPPCQELGLGFVSHHQGSPSPIQTTTLSPHPGGATTPSSALGLLLQSSKLKQTTPSSEPELRQRTSFPDDIQTSFDIDQDSSTFAEDHGTVFGDYDSFASQIFPYEHET